MLLEALGIGAAVFVGAFTWRVYYADEPGSGQSRRASLIEAWTNIVIGFAINFMANLLFLPLLGAEFTWSENFWLGWLYTAVSIIRQYVIRRWFNGRIHQAAKALAGGL